MILLFYCYSPPSPFFFYLLFHPLSLSLSLSLANFFAQPCSLSATGHATVLATTDSKFLEPREKNTTLHIHALNLTHPFFFLKKKKKKNSFFSHPPHSHSAAETDVTVAMTIAAGALTAATTEEAAATAETDTLTGAGMETEVVHMEEEERMAE